MTRHPEVLAVRRDAQTVEIDLGIPADLAWFPDHFPRFPMLPGVVQLAWAIGFATDHFGKGADLRRVSALKFLHPILPRARATLTLTATGTDSVVFRYRARDRACSTGRLEYRST